MMDPNSEREQRSFKVPLYIKTLFILSRQQNSRMHEERSEMRHIEKVKNPHSIPRAVLVLEPLK